MNNNLKKITFLFFSVFCFISLSLSFVFAESKVLYDKRGLEVIETIKPTAENKVDSEEVSDALRRNTGVVDASKHIHSSNTIKPAEVDLSSKVSASDDAPKKTLIRHLTSYNHIDDAYELEEDRDADRLMLRIMKPEGIVYATNSFYKIDGKVYYFDESSHMVLGPCIDNTGKEYFFSYETGELLTGQEN